MPSTSRETFPCPRQSRIIAHALTTLLALIIAALTLVPTVQPPGNFQYQDKVYHLIAFAGLLLPSATLYPRALRWTVPFALALGGAIEIIQPSIGRSGDMADFAADALGVGVGILIGVGAHSWWRLRTRQKSL